MLDEDYSEMQHVFFLHTFDPACYEKTKHKWGRTNLKHVFLNFALQMSKEMQSMIIDNYSHPFLPSFTIWMFTLDPDISERYWQNLEK